MGWLPDCVYVGDKFETGLAFFADARGRITRFSREPADLALARPLTGQAALPGLVNGHSVAWKRALRGRWPLAAGGKDLRAGDGGERLAARLSGDDVFAIARMAFAEMMLAGITCVGEWQVLQRQGDGSAWPEAQDAGRQVLRAAHDVGIRIALFNVATARGGFGQATGSAPAPFLTGDIDAFLRETDALRVEIERQYAPDEAWLGAAPASLAEVPLDAFRAIGAYAHAQRLRLHSRVAERGDDLAACIAEHGRGPIALLAESGLVDKRFTAIHAATVSDAERRLLASARASVCCCPVDERRFQPGHGPIAELAADGVAIALGTGGGAQVDLLKAARLLEEAAGGGWREATGGGAGPEKMMLQAATVAGARSLGATGGALEVGRPADFFTVNLYDPSIAGAEPDALLANVLFALERRAIREVWIGARQRIAGGRHPDQGAIVARFVDRQRRLWGTT